MTLPALLDSIRQLPFVKAVRRSHARRTFLSDRGLGAHAGVFESFAQARQNLPRSAGYETPAMVDEYAKLRTALVFPYDYPVMWWLKQAFGEGASSVYDIGGSVGVHYFAYKRYLDYPPALDWLVSEIPAIVETGRRLCAQRREAAVRFTDCVAPAEVKADVWISAGALHYLEEATGLDVLLQQAAQMPSRIVLNKIPLYNGPAFVSTVNLGHGAFSPHHVYNLDTFISGVTDMGYRLVDSWRVPDREFHLFDDAQRSFGAYAGLAFERVGAKQAPGAALSSTEKVDRPTQAHAPVAELLG